MKIKWLTPIVAGLLAASSGMSYGESAQLSGSVDLGGRFLKNNDNSAKFFEYRDLHDGMFGDFKLELDKGSYYLNLIGNNVGISDKHVGLDDQSFSLKGGKYESFKYSLYYDEIPHNLSFGAKTFMTGVGTNRLTFTGAAPSTNPANWTSQFDYGINRRDYGASVEISLNTPFYFTAKVNELDVKGKAPLGGSTAINGSPVGFVELPAPIDFQTKNLYLETGYRTKDVVVSIDGTVSKFENHNDYLTWQNPNGLGMVNNSIAPDNNYWRLGGQASVRLPLESRLAVKGSVAKLQNNIELLPVNGIRNVFNGDLTYTTASAALSSNPIKPLDFKVYYNYLKKDNESSQIDFGTVGGPNDIFHYEKQNAGLDVGYKLPFKTKAQAGYEFLNVNRSRSDASSTTDNVIYVQLKNDALDAIGAKVRYQYLTRSSDFDAGENTNLTGNPGYFQRFLRRYDATDKKQNAVKLSIDSNPLNHLDLGFEYAFKQNDYDKSRFKRTGDLRHEFLVDASYTLPEVVKFTGYFDYEAVQVDTAHRYFPGTAAGQPNPDVAPNATNGYNWTSKLRDDNYAYGISAEVPVIKNKLDFIASWGYEKADGQVDFASQNDVKGLTHIPNYDDYTKKSINAKAVYKFTKDLNLTAGYAYEKYEYNDAEYNNYLYYVPGATVGKSNFLSGAYNDHNYEANLFYLTAAYKF